MVSVVMMLCAACQISPTPPTSAVLGTLSRDGGWPACPNAIHLGGMPVALHRYVLACVHPCLCNATTCHHSPFHAYINFRSLKVATSAALSSNHSPFFRLCANLLCQYASIPAGSSVLMT